MIGTLHATRRGTEENNTTVAGANDTVVGANTRRYSFFTLPTSYDLYVISGIEWLNGTVVNGSTFAGVERVDANPPTITPALLVAFGNAVSQSGVSAVQRDNFIISELIPGGTILGGWIATASATGRYGTTTVSSANNSKSISPTSTPPISSGATAWAATTEEPYIKIYVRPIQ